jgi:hypothetical protein
MMRHARQGPGQTDRGRTRAPEGREQGADGVGAARAILGLARTPSSRCSPPGGAAVTGAGLGWAGANRPAGADLGPGLAAGPGGHRKRRVSGPTGGQLTYLASTRLADIWLADTYLASYHVAGWHPAGWRVSDGRLG